jgi:HPt (histidine-containing phosphotransfer) domain-containing protein
MASDAQAAISAALDRMWVQFLPQMRERMDILACTAEAFAAGLLSADGQEAAYAAAHKLAGSLGTFGLARGTDLARELEIIYSRQNDPEPELAARLSSITAELRTILESRK